MKVICEICNEYIATVNLEDVSVPMLGSMFKTPDDFHGYDPPFLPDTTWEDMRCGYCNQRPFTERDGFLTDEGYIKIQPKIVEASAIPPSVLEEFEVKVDNVKVELESNAFVCEVCGKICKGKAALGAHMRVHKG
jgi:Zinc finger, C2H2 type.